MLSFFLFLKVFHTACDVCGMPPNVRKSVRPTELGCTPGGDRRRLPPCPSVDVHNSHFHAFNVRKKNRDKENAADKKQHEKPGTKHNEKYRKSDKIRTAICPLGLHEPLTSCDSRLEDASPHGQRMGARRSGRRRRKGGQETAGLRYCCEVLKV